MKLNNGLYIECKFDRIQIDQIYKQFVDIGFKNTLDPKEAHSTICYSKTLPEGDFKLNELSGIARIKGLTIFPKGESGYPLVLELVSSDLQKAHQKYQKDYKLSYDYPEYKPHITICYDLEKSLGITITEENKTETIEKILNSLEITYPKALKIASQSYNDLEENWTDKIKEVDDVTNK